MKIILTVVSLCLGLSFAYKLMCPDSSQWAIRARHLCHDPSKYSCLLDDNADVYIENCTRFDKTRRGERYLIRGDFDSHFCSKDFYQPFTYLTNVSSDCIYTKSLCNEEGQVIYDNADPDKDRKCTCDHTRGYDFVTRPSNPCYCVPSEEDCSCYLNPCMTSDLFRIDDRCTNRTKSSVQNNCLPFKNSSKEERRNLTEHKEQIQTEREFKDPRFQQRCFACTREHIPSVCWCYECKLVLCDDCSSPHLESHHLQHEQDKYKLHDCIQVDGIFTDIKVVNDELLCITEFRSKELVIVDINRRKQQSITLPDSPYHFTVVDNNTLAVTLYHRNGIVIVDTRQGKIIKDIDVKVGCGGIIYERNLLIVGCYDRTIKELSVAGKLIRTLQIIFIPDCICSCGDGRIFGADNENVYCIDTVGRLLFTFNDMGGPCGITIDDIGYVLVVCKLSSNIFRISPDGKQRSVIIKRIPEIGSLSYISYIAGSKLIVVGSQDGIDLYKQTTV